MLMRERKEDINVAVPCLSTTTNKVVRRIYEKAHDEDSEVKVDQPTLFWNAPQGRWDEFHDERPNGFSHITDGQHEGPARNVGGFVRRREFEASDACSPGLLVPFHQLEPAHHGDGTRPSVA
jgi:hypothetical protein